jgi:hypothetical protein
MEHTSALGAVTQISNNRQTHSFPLPSAQKQHKHACRHGCVPVRCMCVVCCVIACVCVCVCLCVCVCAFAAACLLAWLRSGGRSWLATQAPSASVCVEAYKSDDPLCCGRRCRTCTLQVDCTTVAGITFCDEHPHLAH